MSLKLIPSSPTLLPSLVRKVRIANIVSVVGDVVIALTVAHDVQKGRHCCWFAGDVVLLMR